MPPIAYDPTSDSLLHPEDRQSLFHRGPAQSREALAIEASRLAYLRFENSPMVLKQLEDELALAGYASVEVFEDNKTDGSGFGALHTDGSALIAFRGTQADRFPDWVTNAKFVQTKWDTGHVHSGFAKTANGLWPKVDTWLKGPAKNRQSLLMCGHSLGAAIATLLAVRAKAQQLITLGSPRVGDNTFATSLNATPTLDITRIVDCCDVVTEVPPPLMGYRHVGQQRYIDRDGVINNLNTIQIDADRIAANFTYLTHDLKPGNAPSRGLADHAPINYARAFWP
jgi:hypothetical protein